MEIVSLLNGISVGIFGMLLSASFCNIYWTRQKYVFMTLAMMIILAFQGIVYFVVDAVTVRYFYPIITHLPLIIVLYILNKNIFDAINAVFIAYLCCQLRRWLALFATVISSGGIMFQNIFELIITLPLLILLVKFVSNSIRSISYYSYPVKYQFAVIPVLYYVFDYFTQIYTKLLLKGTPVVVEFMPFVCSMAYLVFVLYISQERWNRSQLEQTQECLNLQISQAVREIENLRETQRKTYEYQHDLRHHIQFISSCIENGRLEQAQSYINEIYSEVESNRVIVYCKNEAANLILSAYARRAKNNNVPIKITVGLSQDIIISENDLCVLLSNALENALNACVRLKEEGKTAEIEVVGYEKKGKIFLQIINSCDSDICFEKGIPVTNNAGHGIGVRSMCTLVEKYNGIYTFSVKEKQFILRISI